MSKKNIYLIRILNAELHFEFYHINNGHFSLINTSHDWGVLIPYASNSIIVTLALDLVAVGTRQVKHKKINNSIFYFEKNIIHPKSEIYFFPAIIKQSQLIQLWVKKNLWADLLQKIQNSKLLVSIITLDSCILKASGVLPQQIFNTQTKYTHLIETPFIFTRMAKPDHKIQNFDNLPINTANINRFDINFQTQKNSRTQLVSFFLILLVAINLLLASIPYWGTWNPLQQLWPKKDLELERQLGTIEMLSKQEQFPLILLLEKTLAHIIEPYNNQIYSIYLEGTALTLILENVNDFDVNEISKTFEREGLQVEKILSQNNQTIIEARWL